VPLVVADVPVHDFTCLPGSRIPSSALHAVRGYARRRVAMPAPLRRGGQTGPRHAPSPPSTSLLADDDVGRLGVFHSDDVIAGIDVMNLAGDAAREIAEEIH